LRPARGLVRWTSSRLVDERGRNYPPQSRLAVPAASPDGSRRRLVSSTSKRTMARAAARRSSRQSRRSPRVSSVLGERCSKVASGSAGRLGSPGETLEQASYPGKIIDLFRMPLHGNPEASLTRFDRLDDAVV